MSWVTATSPVSSSYMVASMPRGEVFLVFLALPRALAGDRLEFCLLEGFESPGCLTFLTAAHKQRA